MSLLTINEMSISFASRHGSTQVINNVSLTLERGEVLGLVGESGAGKSTIGNGIVGLLGDAGQVTAGSATLSGEELIGLSQQQLQSYRGKRIGFIFQDPMTSLNPVLTIGHQICESLQTHMGLDGNQAKTRALGLMEDVGIPQPQLRFEQYPHQFSGGMRQRIVIAIALACDPELIIADEPTTALDVSLQSQILELITNLCRDHKVGCILVTHDMGVVSNVTDRVAVLFRGELMEEGPTQQVLKNPQHAYTKSLISAVPRSDIKLKRFPNVEYIEKVGEKKSIDIKTHWIGQVQDSVYAVDKGETLLKVDQVSLKFITKNSFFPSLRQYVKASDHVSFDVKQGETFGLVGGSGSGKSTIARIIAGLYRADEGHIHFAGQDLIGKVSADPVLRQQIQMVFQNPYSSLNPRIKIGESIAEPIRIHRLAESETQVRQIVDDLLDHVGLGRMSGRKYPHEFSGGQRQRICIARALATRPRLLICDEPTSALDVSVQAQILNLLKDLQEELQLTCLFISHDLPVIRQMCDRVAVMKDGQIVEIAATDRLFDYPEHPYSKDLLSLIPNINHLSTQGLEGLIETSTTS